MNEKKIDEILKELDAAYGILSTMLVSHENVQKLAAAEAKLQRVYNQVKDLSKPETPNKKEGD